MCELEQNIPFFKTLIDIFQKIVMISSVNSDFKCVWRYLELCRAQCAQQGTLGLQDSWVLGQGQP